MRTVLILCAVLFMASPVAANPYGTPRLEIVAQLKERPGNIAVAGDGRVFISLHPFDNPVHKVAQVLPDGTLKPFPNDIWARDPGGDGVGLSNVIHLKIVKDTLYIMDMGGAGATPKMVAWDLKSNALKRLWYMPSHVVTAQSFMQDFVVTPDETAAFIADMGQADLAGKADPAIIYLNLETGMAVRKLAGHPSVRPSSKVMRADGQPVELTKEGKQWPLYLGLNPITLDPKGEWVYFGPMGQGAVSRVRVADLVNPALLHDDLAKRVAVFGKKPPSDGILVDGMENVFVTSVNDGSIGVINNRGVYSTWVRDPLLSWPDGMAFGPDGGVYVTVNQLHRAPVFNKGEEKAEPPYMIMRVVGGRPMEKGK
jgi:sugar lactone lactonase YvrE